MKEEEKKIIVEERSRTAKEIHNELAQNLTAISLNLQLCENIIDKKPEMAKEIIKTCTDLLQKSAKELKYSIFEPAAMAKSGLILSLKTRLADFNHIINGSVLIKGKESDFSPGQELFLWRIFNEIYASLIDEQGKRKLDLIFDFSEFSQYMLFNIESENLNIFDDQKNICLPGLQKLFKQGEDLKAQIFTEQADNIINIKINF